MRNEYDNIELLALMEEKDFEELTEMEQNFVLEQISETEYQAYRITVLEGQSALQSEMLTPAPMVGLELKNAFQKQYSKKNFTQLIFSYTVPLWQVILGILGIGMLWMWQNNKSMQETPTKAIETIYVYQTDTVFQPVYLPTTQKTEKKLGKRKTAQPKKNEKVIPFTKEEKKQEEETNIPRPKKEKEPVIFALERPITTDFDLAMEAMNKKALPTKGKAAIEDTTLIQLVERVY